MTTAQIIHQYRKYNESLPDYTRALEKVGRNASLYADYSDPKRKGFILDLVVKYRISSTQIFEIIKNKSDNRCYPVAGASSEAR